MVAYLLGMQPFYFGQKIYNAYVFGIEQKFIVKRVIEWTSLQ
ncbi:hypothetical protein [Staphylococcus succinus]|nr:hypothetical protein [Staphylococcus succinus]